MIYVRGAPDGFQAGETLARGVLGTAHLAVPTGYVGVWSDVSTPIYLGMDSAGCPQWLVRVRAVWSE
jgi:hypothetical protein